VSGQNCSVVRVDVDRAPEIAHRYHVDAVPTAMILLGGERRGAPVVGAHPRARWEQELDLDAVAPSTP
jgi:thioredoxin-like negative regulator of GroEL